MIVNTILLESSYADCLNPYREFIGLTESCKTMEMFYLKRILSFPETRTIFVFLSTCLMFSVYLHRRRTQPRLPPGPWHLPLIGSLLPVAVKLYRTGQEPEHLLAGMSKKYGEVFSLSIGTKIIIVVSGCGAIKEAFQNQHINDRLESEFLQNVGVDTGVVVTSGKSWKYQRALTLNIFRVFGVGRSRFETNIVKEAEVLILGIRNNEGKPFNPHFLIGSCVSNVLCAVLHGNRNDHSDPEFQRIVTLVDRLTATAGPGAASFLLPYSKFVFPQRWRDASIIFTELRAYFEKYVDEHRRGSNGNSPHDFIGCFLNEIELAKSESGDRSDFIHLTSLVATTAFLFMAGIETSSTTLKWALLYMIRYPGIQAKVQSELDSMVCRTRNIRWDDRSSLPYTEAVLMEVQRARTVTPLGLPHVASRDTRLAGYDVPQGAIVVSNVWALHNDPEVWDDPEKFKPERFMDGDGRLRHREEYMPFSTGHRVCLGENLAKMEVFLFFTSILLSFNITSPSDGKPISMEGVSGATFSPEPFDIIATKRQ